MSIKEEIEKQWRARELSREQKTFETKEQLVPLAPRRKELLDHLRQATEGLQVLLRQNEKDGTINLQPSALAQSTAFIEITVYADRYCLETRRMADQGSAQSTAEVRTLAEIDQYITAFLVRMNALKLLGLQGKPENILLVRGFPARDPIGKWLGGPIEVLRHFPWPIVAARSLCRGEAIRKFQARSPDADRIAWALLP